MNHSFRTFNKILLLCFAIVLCNRQESLAVPLPHNGGYVTFGIGYSPYARTALELTEVAEVSSGFAPSVVLGLVWSRKHSLDIRWQSVDLSDSRLGRQGFIAMTYTRYLRMHGPSPFFDLGFGLQHGPFVAENSSAKNIGTTDGLGFTFGAGLRFSEKFEVAADYAVGASGRYLNANVKSDFTHRHLAFSLRYRLFGQ